jgi:hypothetical protein
LKKISRTASALFESLESRTFLSITPFFAHPAARLLGAAAPAPVGTGLTGEYFSGGDFNTPVATTTPSDIEFSWAYGRPVKALPAGVFTARWTGELQVPNHSGVYLFTVANDAGSQVRLIVNGTTLVDSFDADSVNLGPSSGLVRTASQLPLTAGTKVSIELDYRSAGSGPAKVALAWSSSVMAERFIGAVQRNGGAAPRPADRVLLPRGKLRHTADDRNRSVHSFQRCPRRSRHPLPRKQPDFRALDRHVHPHRQREI